MTLAQKIQKYRKIHGLTQEELAEALGVSHQSISKWESGQTTPGLDKVLLLSEFFQISTDALLKADEENVFTPAFAPSPVFQVEKAPARQKSKWLFYTGLALAVAGLLGFGTLWFLSILHPPYTFDKTFGPVEMFYFYIRYNEIEPLVVLAAGAALTGAGGIIAHRLWRKRGA